MPEKVKIRFEGKEYNINKSYVEGLRGYERRKQIKSIIEGKDRPKVKGFKSKRSTWATKFEDKYGTKISDKEFITKNNGNILVESKIGVGSKFTFLLPLNVNEISL